MAEKKPEPDAQTEKPKGKAVVLMPVSDVAVFDDDEYAKGYPDVPWPWDGRSEEEVLAASKKLPEPTGE